MALIRINRNPSTMQLRQFSGIWFPAFCLLLGYIIGRKTGHWPAVQTAWILLAALSVTGVVFPRAMRPVWIGLMLVTWPIGWTVSHLLLGGIYYLLVTPIGFVLRVLGKDPLARRFEKDAASYWVEREGGERPLERYFRQF